MSAIQEVLKSADAVSQPLISYTASNQSETAVKLSNLFRCCVAITNIHAYFAVAEQTAVDMVTGRHLELKNGRRYYIIWHISEYIYNRWTKIGTHTLYDIWNHIWSWYWHDNWPPSWILKWTSWMSIIRHISDNIYDKSTKGGTYILCDMQFHMQLSTNYYRHGIWPPSWI